MFGFDDLRFVWGGGVEYTPGWAPGYCMAPHTRDCECSCLWDVNRILSGNPREEEHARSCDSGDGGTGGDTLMLLVYMSGVKSTKPD